MYRSLFACFLIVFLPVAVFSQSLDDKIRTAVKGLEQSQRFEVVIEPPVLQGTNTVTALSAYLQGEIRHYATNSPGFTVVESARSAPKGRITGHYTETGAAIRITLKLFGTTDNTTEKASKQFDVPTAELAELGLDWSTPENIETLEEAEDQHKVIVELENDLTNNTTLSFEAWLNSDSRVYYDGDYMTVSIRANQDGYFTVRHIDVNDNSQLIFPNRGDTDNLLKKDETRTIFERPTRVRLHEPFGQEQLLITVSAEPFNNLEKAMITPVLANSFGDIVIKTRGATVETLPVSNDTQYLTKSISFSILPFCHTVFEFVNPIQALQEIAEDVKQRGGTFEGNNSEGFYIINNERVNYEVHGSLITLLTRLSPESASRSVARGATAPLRIDLTMPRSSIPQQIELTGDKIKEAGGVFTGDITGGNFEVQKPVEVIGNYQVLNENITVSITKYPALFAGIIKSKIKEYFSAR